MNVTVFLASRPGNDPRCRTALEELAAWLGAEGHTLVYGGSKVGLMGVLAATAKRAGARVIGIEPRFFVEAGRQYDGVDELIVTEDMAERKEQLIRHADAVIAFPGGLGTLEELAQTLSMVNLGQISPKCIVYNVGGYYDDLRALLRRMVEAGFCPGEVVDQIIFADSLAEIAAALGGQDNG